jgi:hypothetical protein
MELVNYSFVNAVMSIHFYKCVPCDSIHDLLLCQLPINFPSRVTGKSEVVNTRGHKYYPRRLQIP